MGGVGAWRAVLLPDSRGRQHGDQAQRDEVPGRGTLVGEDLAGALSPLCLMC